MDGVFAAEINLRADYVFPRGGGAAESVNTFIAPKIRIIQFGHAPSDVVFRTRGDNKIDIIGRPPVNTSGETECAHCPTR